MPNLVDLLRRLADEYESEEKGEASAATDARIEALEKAISDRPKDERRDALEELSDDERELIRAHREGKAKPPPPEAEPVEEVEEVEPPKPRTRPGRRSGAAYSWTVDDDGNVTKLDIPHIYHGETEPDEVELPAPAPPAESDAA